MDSQVRTVRRMLTSVRPLLVFMATALMESVATHVTVQSDTPVPSVSWMWMSARLWHTVETVELVRTQLGPLSVSVQSGMKDRDVRTIQTTVDLILAGMEVTVRMV